MAGRCLAVPAGVARAHRDGSIASTASCWRPCRHYRTAYPPFYAAQELRTRFLACREEYHAELLADLDEGSAYDYLKRLTDVHRLHLFDVVMQFRAIFSDDSSAQVPS